jgi:hypothetical protein
MKTIKRSELNGVTGWVSSDGEVRLCHIKARWFADGSYGTTLSDDKECEICGDTPLTGDSLIAALRERGVEVIDDTQPAKPVESKPDKWAHLPEGGEWGRFANSTVIYHRVGNFQTPYWTNPTPSNGTPMHEGGERDNAFFHDWTPLTRAEAIAIFEANATPEVKPAETPAFKVGDRVEVVGPFDENWNLYVKSLLRCIGKVGTVWRIDSDGVIHTDIALGSHGGFMFHPANLRPAPVDTKAKEPAGDEVAKLRKELDEANRQIEEMFRQRDDLVRQRDSLAGRIDELNGKLDAIEQPPMSDERFRQEAAIAAMQGMIARDADREASLGSDAEYYAKAANALLAAMKGGAA